MKNDGKNNRNTKREPDKKLALKVTPLGGVGEIGKNLTVVEYGDDMVVIDCGLIFPREDMLGIDYIIPDTTYIEKNISKLRGILLTHGHEDHIGGLPYILPRLSVPVYGTEFTMLLVDAKKIDHDFSCDAHTIAPGDVFKLGCFEIEAIRVNHSIDGAVAYSINTPAGRIIHTGDFKIDYASKEKMTDLNRFARLGSGGVLAMLSDSTNAETSGYTRSESLVAETFLKCLKRAHGRVILATFSSNIRRIQQVADACAVYGRKIAVCGRSMLKIVALSREYGYLDIPEDTMIDITEVDKYPPNDILILTTGSQGEAMSGLTRMASGEHRQISIQGGDMVIVSANPIPGNERYVGDVINMLYRRGAEVVDADSANVHASGHGCQEEQKLLLSVVKPKYFIPVHGEYRHLYSHAATARQLGIPDERILIPDIGRTIEVTKKNIHFGDTVDSGNILIDGLGVGDIGSVVLRDRKVLSQDGLVVAVIMLNKDNGKLMSEPEIISRGFVYVRESEKLMDGMKSKIIESVKLSRDVERTELKRRIKKSLREMIYVETQRNPMILPVVFEV